MRRIDRRNNPRKAHVRHILLANKPQAREILEQIQNSKKPLKEFKKLAKRFSNCPSGSKKGDLGEFVEGQMVLDFEKAVWEMEPESTPDKFVKTQFGFHIIWVHTKSTLNS
tara:strand:+ start:1339 stop:1671 length:333 start_codon:yes stop_codon:yes gene_type:complete